jgi:hypothetical protein
MSGRYNVMIKEEFSGAGIIEIQRFRSLDGCNRRKLRSSVDGLSNVFSKHSMLADCQCTSIYLLCVCVNSCIICIYVYRTV